MLIIYTKGEGTFGYDSFFVEGGYGHNRSVVYIIHFTTHRSESENHGAEKCRSPRNIAIEK